MLDTSTRNATDTLRLLIPPLMRDVFASESDIAASSGESAPPGVY